MVAALGGTDERQGREGKGHRQEAVVIVLHGLPAPSPAVLNSLPWKSQAGMLPSSETFVGQ